MLVLTRRRNEEIVINGTIRISILGIEGNRVRIGIVAPPSVPIHRDELLSRMPQRHADEPALVLAEG